MEDEDTNSSSEESGSESDGSDEDEATPRDGSDAHAHSHTQPQPPPQADAEDVAADIPDETPDDQGCLLLSFFLAAFLLRFCFLSDCVVACFWSVVCCLGL